MCRSPTELNQHASVERRSVELTLDDFDLSLSGASLKHRSQHATSRLPTNTLRVSQNLDPCARSYRGLEVSDPCITILNIRSLLHYIPRGLPGPLEALIPGSHGRVLAVLAKTDAELTMRTVAKLSGTSIGSASGVLNHFAHLGLVERREVGSAVLVRLSRENEAARLVLDLAELQSRVVDRMRAEARRVKPTPVTLLLFGSFVHGEATETSDIDVLAITDPNQPSVSESLGRWCEVSSRIAGNPVSLITASKKEWPKLLSRNTPIARGGILLAGVLPPGAEELD